VIYTVRYYLSLATMHMLDMCMCSTAVNDSMRLLSMPHRAGNALAARHGLSDCRRAHPPYLRGGNLNTFALESCRCCHSLRLMSHEAGETLTCCRIERHRHRTVGRMKGTGARCGGLEAAWISCTSAWNVVETIGMWNSVYELKTICRKRII
jgi:hypothetical protein